MPHDVTMPQLGMAQDAGKIVSWLKRPGDTVAKGDALFEVETDKATMEVEAQASGYLIQVTAAEGEDVPVGQVIARISDSADDDAPAAAPPPQAADTDALPEGRTITMPQLGMAQDSGVLVGWLVEPGAKVGADDPLFEVETDKATMEVPAGVTGYLAATLAQPGDDVPVGQAVAVISPEKPASTLARPMAESPAAGTPVAASARKTETAPMPRPEPAPKPAEKVATPSVAGRILASPKLRRVALEKGLDLGRLAAAGHPQPYHMRDLAVLEGLGAAAPAAATATAPQAARRLSAATQIDGLTDFTDWAAQELGLTDADAVLAGLAGFGHARVVAIERIGVRRVYAVPRRRSLSLVVPTEDAPELILRDLRATALSGIEMGAEDAPVLTLMRQGTGLAITLECASEQLSAPDAIQLLTDFAARVEHPLHLLL